MLAEDYIKKVLHPLVSGQPFYRTWRYVRGRSENGGFKMYFGNSEGRALEILLLPMKDVSQTALARSANFVVSCTVEQLDAEQKKVLRAIIAMLQLNDSVETAIQWQEGMPHHPFKIADLSLCNRCLNRCFFCGSVRQDIPEPETDEVKRLLDKYRAEGFDGVEFSSKEFVLRKDAAEIIRFARESGFEMLHLVTSGLPFATYEKTEKLLGAGINKLTVSLHSDSEADEARITGNPNAFAGKIKGVRNVMRYAAEKGGGGAFVLSVNTVMTPSTLPRMDRIMLFIAQLGIRRHNIFFPKIHPHMIDAFDMVVPRFADVRAPLSSGIRAVRPFGMALAVVDVPPCSLPDNTAAVFERLRKKVYSACDETGPGEISYDVRREKVKGPPCERCSLACRCEGVFERYVERRGWGEFSPLE